LSETKPPEGKSPIFVGDKTPGGKKRGPKFPNLGPLEVFTGQRFLQTSQLAYARKLGFRIYPRLLR
jgi:hypothetical protein